MKKSLLFGALLALPLAAMAEGLSYNYVQLGWIANGDADVDGDDNGVPFSAEGDVEGFALEGLFSFTDMLYIKGGYADTEVDIDGGGTNDGQTLELGVGAHTNQFTGGVDLYGELSFLDVESGGFDDNGFGVEIGARTLFTQNIEGSIAYSFADVGDIEADGFTIGGLYHLTPQWSLGVEFASGEAEASAGNSSADTDTDTWTLGARYNF